MTDRSFILENLAYRISNEYLGSSVNIGNGVNYPLIVVVHDDHTIPERDGTSGALKRFGLLEYAYRVPYKIIDDASEEENRAILKELLEILRPMIVVTSGKEATELVIDRPIDSYKNIAGKEYRVNDLTFCVLYAILSPDEYSFARAPSALKEQGKAEWSKLANIFDKLTQQHENIRWS